MLSRLSLAFLGCVSIGLFASDALAVTSTRSVPSAFGGNGHNISFDGRLLLVRDSLGWGAQLLRPEAATYLPDGLPDASGPLLSPRVHVFGDPNGTENALALCEDDASHAPYACDESGAANAAGPFDCYDVTLIDSDAVTAAADGGFVMRRRRLQVWVSSPRSADALIYKAIFGAPEPLSPTLKGIEPTITRDGKLLVYQGHPANDGTIDILMYAVNANACAASGWSSPKPISSMFQDPLVTGTYPLAERRLRAADGTPFDAGDLFHGAYPWLMPDGDAIIFAAAPMPCRATEDPPGCGPRRNALSVVGYPTNWGVAHIDGGANPDTDNTVRLFFSSPGPKTFSELPVSSGVDVWPFFGSNTSNYVELSFDDGLDGNYAGLWHLNESVNAAGELDTTKTPDVSGYFNTGSLEGGLTFAKANDGALGKSLAFDGVDDRVVVANATSLNPANGVTIEFSVAPSEPDCDAANNWRLLIGKGDIANGSYSVVLEENHALQARVNVGGTQVSLASPALPLDTWTHVAFEYDGATGNAGFWFDGVQVTTATLAAGTITSTTDALSIGGPGARAACPDGDGAFQGRLDEVSISRFARHLGEPPIGPGPGEGGAGGGGVGGSMGPTTTGSGAASGDGGAGGAGTGGDSASDGGDGCSCRTGARRDTDAGGATFALLALGSLATRVRRRRGSRLA
ncbi:MAG: LamG domain-containing protein [Polyangiaceae bacterium]